MKSTDELFRRMDTAGISQNNLSRRSKIANTTIIGWRRKAEGHDPLVDRAYDVVTEIVREKIKTLTSLLPENANTGDTNGEKSE